jgi:hypothetical protein
MCALNLRRIENQWHDALEVASCAPRIALSSEIANLEEIRIELNAIQVNEDLLTAKQAVDCYMELVINAFLEFQQKEFVQAKNLLEASKKPYKNLKFRTPSEGFM